MKSAFVSLATVAFFAGAFAQQLTINTPTNPVVCQPLLLTWSGGTPPYFLSVLPGNQPNAQALIDFGQQNGTTLTWRVNLASGTSVGLNLRDNSGQTAQSAPFTLNAGSDTSCVGQPVSTSGGTGNTSPTGSTAAGTSAAGTGTTAAGTTAASTTAAGTTAAGTTNTSPSSPTTTAPSGASTTRASTSGTSTGAAPGASTTNAAPANAVQFGVAGMIGAAVIALLA